MATSARKQREFQQREQAILDVAREMLAERGYLGLNMDRIAEALEYSKGTIYQHFSSKEDLLMALAVQTSEKRPSMFARAAAFDGSSRERVTAIGCAAELFVQLFPDHFRVEQILQLTSIWEKTSEQRQQLLRACQSRCLTIVSGIVRDAIDEGDLELPEFMTPEDLVFGMWSMSFGGYSIIATSEPLTELGIHDAFMTVRKNMMAMLDGYGWRPLSHEWDYLATFERVQHEVFADECRALITT